MKNSDLKEQKRRHLILATLVLIFLMYSFSMFAQQEQEDKTLSPYFFVLSDDPETDQMPLKSTSAEVNIVGVIADVTICQSYKNESDNPLEAVYTFPASTNAAIYAMEMTIGDRIIKAKIEERGEARKNYEKAKSEGKRTSLLEQQRPNVFQMNVANIMPGDIINVVLKYTELLVPENGRYSFVYPAVVGPRYSGQSAADANERDGFVNTPYQKEGEESLYDFDINLFLSTGVPIQNVVCPSHRINISYPEPCVANIELDAIEKKGGDRDFVLDYQLSGSSIESGLMLYENGGENFFLLMVQPPKRIIEENIPPREYIFIVDVSGSMRGFPIEVSKKLLRNLVVNLKNTDRFNVLLFAGTSGWFAEESVYATVSNVDRAIEFIDNQRGSGGTNLLPALKKALNFPRKDEALSRSFVIVTDGYVHVEKEAFDFIRNHSDEANTFAFGIGRSVNRYLINGMAHVGMGEPFVVLDQEHANEKAEKFRKYINNPVLTQVKKSFANFDVYDIEPVTVPDVMAERPVIIYGKYRGEPKGTITIKGFAGKKRYKKIFDVASVMPDKRNVAIRYLWARERIKLLSDYGRVCRSENVKEEVTELGLKYSLMTAYTSFLAVDEKKVADGRTVRTVKQPLPMPQGVSNHAIGFDMSVEGGDMDGLTFTFYRDISILYGVPDEVMSAMIDSIESYLIINLNTCFEDQHSFPESITVTIDTEGNVTDININGKAIDSKFEQCVRAIISKWDFSEYGLTKEWKFRINF